MERKNELVLGRRSGRHGSETTLLRMAGTANDVGSGGGGLSLSAACSSPLINGALLKFIWLVGVDGEDGRQCTSAKLGRSYQKSAVAVRVN